MSKMNRFGGGETGKMGQQVQRRRRFKHGQSLEDRLVEQAARLREEASALPPGPERETILRRAEQTESAVSMSQWLSLPGSKPNA